jgi:C1A family cysteine protease
MATAVAVGAVGPIAALPPQVDLRQPWWDIGDQQATGSCVGWATAEGVMRYLFVAAGRLGQADHLSPRYIWMSSKETDMMVSRPETFIEDAGTTLKAAADICRNFGVALETALPFHISTTMFLGREDDFFAAAAQLKAASYFNAGLDLNSWRHAVADGKPVLVALNVDREWDSAADRAGLLDTFQPNTVRGGHCVCVVGYREDGRFIIRNSWGTTWGDQGFAYASEAYIQNAFFQESYVLTL